MIFPPKPDRTLKFPFKRQPRFHRDYLWSKIAGKLRRNEWKDVHTIALFVGYPRTGASMMGALLDAHPDMVFAQELHMLRLNELYFKRDQIFSLVLRSSKRFTDAGAAGRGHVAQAKYSYAVPGQWQGRYRKLLVMGDKQAPGTTSHLTDDPHLAAKFAKDLGMRLRMIHMIRNPFDCINGIFRLKNGRKGKNRHLIVRDSVTYYFRLLGGMVELRRRHPDDILDLRMEDLIAKPIESLELTCSFLGVECPRDYAEACASIIFDKPNSVTDAKWTREDIDLVKQKIAEVPFLKGYTVPPAVEAIAASAD